MNVEYFNNIEDRALNFKKILTQIDTNVVQFV